MRTLIGGFGLLVVGALFLAGSAIVLAAFIGALTRGDKNLQLIAAVGLAIMTGAALLTGC
jgi:hypothetical protein